MDRDEIFVKKNLKALESCDIHKAWEYIKPEVEKFFAEEGKYAGVPYITEGSFYDVGRVFIKTSMQNTLTGKQRNYVYLGTIERVCDKSKSNEGWIKDAVCNKNLTPLNVPRTLKISVQDESTKKTIKVVSTGFTKNSFQSSAVNELTLDRNAAPELSRVKKIYFIDEVIYCDSFEIRMGIGVYSRVFYIGIPQPILMSYKKLVMNGDYQIIAYKDNVVKSKNAVYQKIKDDSDLLKPPEAGVTDENMVDPII